MIQETAALFATRLALGGCASMSPAQTQRVEAEDDATCTSYGLRIGTTAYAECRLIVSQNRETRNAAERQNMREVGAYLMTQ